MKKLQSNYISKLQGALASEAMSMVPVLAQHMLDAWNRGHQMFICGNGGSAGNAIHLANDFIYGAGRTRGKGLKVEALSANPAVLTCLANDIGYDHVYSEQLKVKAEEGDLLLVLSGSGNSPNIVRALETGNQLGMTTFAVLAYSGGLCKQLALHPIYFDIDDMQVAEDLQLIVGHMCMQWLCAQN
ncbi:MAG: SIS domain-containing protein [Sulfuritalea sp.]|jgi:D-sedoheptulose 7-phosphate isomerase|nr:SIS domain-containing protein [Sulfuritalea sp.]